MDVVLIEILMITISGLMFLLAGTRMIHLEYFCLASIINMNKLSEYNNWYGDDTFSIDLKYIIKYLRYIF